jgi:hypothetical protein
MSVAKGIRTEAIPSALAAAFLLGPPGWTRLEPQSVSGDPTPGLEARLHDPLWLLTRQWQLGEFAAEDAGSPVAVHVASTTVPVTKWRPGDPSAGAADRPLPAGDLLEPSIEREPSQPRGPGLRDRAEAGGELVVALADAGVDVTTGSPTLTALLAQCPLALPWRDDFDHSAPGLLAVLAGRVPDGELAAESAAPSLAASPAVLPSWVIDAPDDTTALAAVSDWYDWYRSQVAPEPDPGSDCWIDDRLEYRFGLRVGAARFEAPSFGGGRVDWSDLDATDLTNPAAGAPAAAQQTMLATPLRFAGMPADRYWQFEDGQVNLGALEVQPHDLARLLLVEFATVYGNDWLVVPVDVPLGSFTAIDEVAYTTTFGERPTVSRVDDSDRSGTFRLFEVSVAGSDETVPGLFVPPSVTGVLDGPALEEVLFLRDEMANSAWGVERTVEGPSGDPRNRHDEGYPPPFVPGNDPSAELDYRLQTDVPSWWIPFLPYSTGYATIALAKGLMLRGADLVEPLGVLLHPGESMKVEDEEVPREGVRVRRVRTLARRVDGSYARWVTRRVTIGKGEGASGLAFDSTVARTPLPPPDG